MSRISSHIRGDRHAFFDGGNLFGMRDLNISNLIKDILSAVEIAGPVITQKVFKLKDTHLFPSFL